MTFCPAVFSLMDEDHNDTCDLAEGHSGRHHCPRCDMWWIPRQPCGEYLMENDWAEGFTCSLPPGHEPPHRDQTDERERNESTDRNGRRYEWVYEWEYKS